MAYYTTGEIAKVAKVTVRTIQYYDRQGWLHPSALSEGGWRLYEEKDLTLLKLICFLRSLGLSLKDIAAILKEEEHDEVIMML